MNLKTALFLLVSSLLMFGCLSGKRQASTIEELYGRSYSEWDFCYRVYNTKVFKHPEVKKCPSSKKVKSVFDDLLHDLGKVKGVVIRQEHLPLEVFFFKGPVVYNGFKLNGFSERQTQSVYVWDSMQTLRHETGHILLYLSRTRSMGDSCHYSPIWSVIDPLMRAPTCYEVLF